MFCIDKSIKSVFVGASCLIQDAKHRNHDGGEAVGIPNLVSSKEGETHVLAIVCCEAKYEVLAKANHL